MYQGQLKTAYDEALEYHGSTTVEVTRCRHGRIIWRDWLIFDSVAEASEYYNTRSQGSGERIRWMGRGRIPLRNEDGAESPKVRVTVAFGRQGD